MADIFISYSSHDREKAEQLTELLMSAGLSVWIDNVAIDAATSWSKEIVSAINGCTVFVLLLSPSSLQSHNVIKEVSLASEKRKKILPIDLEPVMLTEDFEYQLAGIQRAPMSNIDAIIRAIEKLGLEVTNVPELTLVKEESGKKSLMILPFEDLSPTADNEWFADGLASELIGALSHIKSLKLIDWNTSREFKKNRVRTTTLAKEFAVRYFIEGQVRKFGDQIKISITLLDIETGDHLWQDSMKGTMSDIFDIQEKAAESVVEGLKVHLAPDEQKTLAEPLARTGTVNAEAYELYMRAKEYFSRQTKEGFQLAIHLFAEAITLDVDYAQAYEYKANALTGLYRAYDRTPALLDEAETLLRKALRIKPDLYNVYGTLSHIYLHRGQLAESEEMAREFIRKQPQNYSSHFSLGFFYMETGQYANAIAPYEEAVRLKPDHIASLWNLVISCDNAEEREQCAHWAAVALPQFERFLKLHPDDEGMRAICAHLLLWSGRADEAHAAAMKLTNLSDGMSLFNTACLFEDLGDYQEALRTFRKAIDAGYRNLRRMNDFLTDEKSGVLALQGTAEYEEVKQLVEKIRAEATGHG